MAWALWGYHPDTTTELLAAGWPLFLLLSLLLLGRGGSRQTRILAVAAITPIVILIIVALYDRELFEVRYFLVAVPLLFLLIARLVTGWIHTQRAPGRPRGRDPVHLAVRAPGPADERRQPAAVRLPRRDQGDPPDAGPKSLLVRASRHALRAGVLRARLRRRPLRQGVPRPKDGSPVFVIASFQDNKLFFDRTNRVVGKLDFPAPAAKFEMAQTKVWEFR